MKPQLSFLKVIIFILFIFIIQNTFSQVEEENRKKNNSEIPDFPIADDAIVLKDADFPQFYTLSLLNGKFDIDYTSNEFRVRNVFDSSGKSISDKIDYYYLDQIPPESQLVLGADSIVLIFKEKISPGEYLIQFSNNDGSKIHNRKFIITEGKPKVNSVKLISRDGNKNEIHFDPSLNWKKQIFEFEFDNGNTQFESVSFQDLDLQKMSENRYQTTDDWTAEAIKNINPEKNEFTFKRAFVSAPDKHEFNLTVPKPIINSIIATPVGVNQKISKVSLDVANLRSQASVQLINLPEKDVINEKREFNVTIPKNQSKIDFDVELKSSSTEGYQSFQVVVLIGENTSSDAKTVDVQIVSSIAESSQAYPNAPLIKGVKSSMRFDIKDGNVIDPNKDLIIKVGEETYTSLEIENRNPKWAIVKFALKESTNSNEQFELINGDNSWSGILPDLQEKPKIIIGKGPFYSNSTVLVKVSPANNQAKMDFSTALSSVKWKGDEFSTSQGELEIKNMLPDEQEPNFSFGRIKIILKINEEIIDSVEIKVWNRDLPESLVEVPFLKDKKGKTKKEVIVVDSGSTLSIDQKSDSQSDNLEGLFIQLLNSEGANIGDPKNLTINSEGNFSADFDLINRYGIKGGSNFSVLLKNGDKEKSFKGYLKRNCKDRFIITAGISALSVYFNEQETYTVSDTIMIGEAEVLQYDTTRSNTFLLEGLNIGLFYSPEIMFEGGKRPVSFGLNLIGFESGGKVKTRVALSTLFFETLTVGISFGQKEPAIFLGANITLLDFANLFNSDG